MPETRSDERPRICRGAAACTDRHESRPRCAFHDVGMLAYGLDKNSVPAGKRVRHRNTRRSQASINREFDRAAWYSDTVSTIHPGKRQRQIWTGHRLGEKATGDLQSPHVKILSKLSKLSTVGKHRIGARRQPICRDCHLYRHPERRRR
jgi:hypothetical protein